jgi:hypothetical protein
MLDSQDFYATRSRRSITKIALPLFLLASKSVTLGAEAPSVSKSVNPCLEVGVKQSVVFLGRLVPKTDPKGEPVPASEPVPAYVGTGFLVQVEQLLYLVTAKHMVEGFGPNDPMFVFVNDKNGKLANISDQVIRTQLNVEWFKSSSADLAILPFGTRSDFDVTLIPEAAFLTSDNVLELQDVFFMSYQSGIQDESRITPIARRGMVSIRNEDGTFYLDAFAFPGNSGSPVFIKPSAGGSFTTTGINLGAEPNNCKFVGMIGEYLPYREVAVSLQTKRARVVFEENTWLAKVWPVQSLQQLMKSPEFQQHHQAVKKLIPAPKENSGEKLNKRRVQILFSLLFNLLQGFTRGSNLFFYESNPLTAERLELFG